MLLGVVMEQFLLDIKVGSSGYPTPGVQGRYRNGPQLTGYSATARVAL